MMVSGKTYNRTKSQGENVMSYVKTLLQTKAPGVLSVSPQAKVIDALKLMAEKNVGALVVLEGECLAGIFSERDYARKVALLGKTSLDTPVSDIMTTPVLTITLNQTHEDCMALMSAKRVRHLPVMEGQKVIGLLSIGDIVKDALHEQENTIRHLEDYVNS
jgi:CBS domain-containing protein